MIGSLLLLSVLTGIITGFFISIYQLLTTKISFLLFFGNPIKTISTLPFWYLYLIPTVSILLVNYIISKNDTVKEYGVKKIAEAIEQNKLNFGLKDLLLKIFVSSLSIASGFAIGNEGPSSEIGAMISQKIHLFLKIPNKLMRISLSIGSASGIAAIFVSPVTGITFAIENIAYKFVKDYIGYLIVGSAIAFSIASYFIEPLIFGYSTGKIIKYRYIFATLLFIPFISIFIYFYLFFKDKIFYLLHNKISEKFLPYKNILFALIGGGTIGTIMFITPYGVFSGHAVVKALINNNIHLSIYVLFGIVILRIIATTVSLYANAIGGLFITLMSIGALIGYGFGEMINVIPNIQVEPFYFAAIGASVFMGVNMKLPLTAVVLALETTYDYNVVVPVGLTVVIVSYIINLKFDLHKLTLKKTLTT